MHTTIYNVTIYLRTYLSMSSVALGKGELRSLPFLKASADLVQSQVRQ